MQFYKKRTVKQADCKQLLSLSASRATPLEEISSPSLFFYLAPRLSVIPKYQTASLAQSIPTNSPYFATSATPCQVFGSNI